METPAVSVDEAPINGNGNGNGNGHGNGRTDKPVTKVDDLFARIRADRSTVPSPPSPPSPPEPVPPAASAGVESSHLDPISSEHALARRDELLDEVEAGLTRALKRVLQDEQNELLDRLRRLGSASPSAEAVLPGSDDQRAGYRAVAVRWMEQAARAGVRFASDTSPGAGAEKADPSVGALADDLATAVVGPLRGRVARILDDADDQMAAAESVRAVYRQWKVQHVEESARHHLLVAFNLGAFTTAADGAVLQWLVDDQGHCPDCDDNALAGPTVKGQAFPTGQLHPPAHPGCRCLLVPAGSPRPT
jgi:hypothetical protein